MKSDTPIILDPVIVFKENADYSVNEMRDLFISQLFPLATVITPNLKEAEILTGLSVKSKSEMKEAAKLLHDFGAKNVVIKEEIALTKNKPLTLLMMEKLFMNYQARL